MLKRIPSWGWFLILLFFCYAMFNPFGVSIVHIVQDVGLMNPFVWMLAFAVMLPLVMAAWQTMRELNWFGRVVYVLGVTFVIWAMTYVVDTQAMIDTVGWWLQVVIAGFLTIGLRFAKWRRDITSTTSVDDAGAVEA